MKLTDTEIKTCERYDEKIASVGYKTLKLPLDKLLKREEDDVINVVIVMARLQQDVSLFVRCFIIVVPKPSRQQEAARVLEGNLQGSVWNRFSEIAFYKNCRQHYLEHLYRSDTVRRGCGLPI